MRALQALLLLVFTLAANAGTNVFRLENANGTPYTAYLPIGWEAGNGAVLYNQGFDPVRDSSPSAPDAVVSVADSLGFAVIALGYSQRGWSLFKSGADAIATVAAFQASFAAPGKLYAIGGSLGGLVALQQAELSALGKLPPMRGVLAACTPTSGSRVWDQALDVRLAYDAICNNVTLGELPRDSQVPYLLPRSAVNGKDDPLVLAEVAIAAGKCLGLNVGSALETSGMRERRARMLAATRVSEPFLDIQIYYATFGLSDLYFDPLKLNRGAAFENRGVNYGDSALNSQIRRVASDPLQRLFLRNNYTPVGRMDPDTRVVLIHTSGDGLVVPEHLSLAQQIQQPGRVASFVVRESTPSHCDFSVPETAAAFRSLIIWEQTFAPPVVDRLQAQCQSLASATAFQGPCRFENPNVASLDTKIRPRVLGEQPVDNSVSGLWYNPSRSGEGFVLETLPDNRALLIWFTFPAKDLEVGPQFWVIGEGRVSGNTMTFEAAVSASGLVDNADPSRFSLVPFGSIRLAFDRCGHAVGEFTGPTAYGSGTLDLVQLSQSGGQTCAQPAVSSIPQTRFAGTWTTTVRTGFNFSVQGDGRVIATWYNYDQLGNPIWLVGEGRFEGDRLVVPRMTQPIGTRFGADFRSSEITQPPFASISVRFADCNNALLSFFTTNNFLRPGDFDLRRLTIPKGITCFQ